MGSNHPIQINCSLSVFVYLFVLGDFCLFVSLSVFFPASSPRGIGPAYARHDIDPIQLRSHAHDTPQLLSVFLRLPFRIHPFLPKSRDNERHRGSGRVTESISNPSFFFSWLLLFSSQTVGTTGSTPLHFAAANGCLAIVEILLRHGATPDLADKVKDEERKQLRYRMMAFVFICFVSLHNQLTTTNNIAPSYDV